MNNLRKVFYALDMAVVGFFLFALNHSMIIENDFVGMALYIAILLRIFIPILLYHQEKLTIFPLLVFGLLFGVAFCTDAFRDFVVNMARFPSSVFVNDTNFQPMVLERPIKGEMLMKGVIYWIWLIPLAIYAIQFVTKRIKSNGYPWYYFIGGVLFKDSVGKLLLSMALPLFSAFAIGYEMEEYLSFYALIALPIIGYYLWNKHCGRSPNWAEYGLLIIGLYIFGKAQYRVDNERIVFLVLSAVMILSVCGWMCYKTRNVIVSMLAFLMAAFLLPTVSLGYNIYNGIEGKRSVNYPNVGIGNNKGYMYVRRIEIVDGKEKTLVGVRDRYQTTIPCEYMFVLPTNIFSPFAKCVKENRDSVIRSVERGYILE